MVSPGVSLEFRVPGTLAFEAMPMISVLFSFRASKNEFGVLGACLVSPSRVMLPLLLPLAAGFPIDDLFWLLPYL